MSPVRLRWVSRVALSLVLAFAAGIGLMSAIQGPGLSHVPSTPAIEQNNIGVGYMNQYLFKEASDAFRKALSIDSQFNLAMVNLGISLLYDQELDEAGTVLQDALSRDAANPYALFCRGLVLKGKGDIDKATENFRKVVEIDGKCAAAHYNLGILYARQNRDVDSEAAFRRTLQLEPNNTSALYNLGTLLLKIGHQEEGNRVLERFREFQSKGSAGEGMAVGTSYGEMGQYALAVDYKPHISTVPTLTKPQEINPPFADRTEEAGLSKIGPTAERVTESWAFSAADWSPDFLRTHLLRNLGGGIALADLDGDGDIDAVVIRYNHSRKTWETFVLLNDGKGHFSDATEASGIRNGGAHVSAAIGDYDNDGRPDVYLVGLGGNRLYRNLGQARFEDVTSAANVADGGLCVSATFVDYDHDGDLDLYVSHLADVSKLRGSGKVLLLMDAWIDYADSSSNLAAAQAGLSQIPPYLQVKNAKGEWETAIPSIGFPAGLPKTMTLDLSGVFPTSDHHVRIVTNMKIYWDRIRVDTSPDLEVRLTRLDPVSADLHFRGYPNPDKPEPRKDRALRAFVPFPECHQLSAVSLQLRISHQLFSADSFWIREVSIRLISITPPANRS